MTVNTPRFKTLDERFREVLEAIRKLSDRVDLLESVALSKMPTVPPTPIPPMRDRAESIFEVEQFKDKILEAVEVGKREKDSTPEAKVREVVIETIAKKDEQRELARLQMAEAAEKERLRLDAIERANARKMRSKMVLSAVVTALLSLIVFLVERALEAPKVHP